MATDIHSVPTSDMTHVTQSTSAMINHYRTAYSMLVPQCYKHLSSYKHCTCIHCHSTCHIMQGSDQLMELYYSIAAIHIPILASTWPYMRLLCYVYQSHPLFSGITCVRNAILLSIIIYTDIALTILPTEDHA